MSEYKKLLDNIEKLQELGFNSVFNLDPYLLSIDDVAKNEAMANKHGFTKVSQLKLAVANKIKEFVHNPKGKDGKEANYGSDCSFTIVNNADGTGVTSKAYPNVLPLANELKMVDNLKGDWTNRAKQIIITFEIIPYNNLELQLATRQQSFARPTIYRHLAT